MSNYSAPLRDMQFVMRDLAGLDEVTRLPGNEDVTPDLVAAILEEADKFAAGVLAPLNRSGDQHGARWHDGEVSTAPGWKEAYRQFAESGWTAIACDPQHGGQGLPKLVSTAVMEMWKSANMAFSLCPMLTTGAIEALMLRGSEAQKAMYLPKMVSGEWTGTMNLTEPQAGSDVGALRTKAEPMGDGTYAISGQKIYITWGDSDLVSNVCHLVLARLPGAPQGTRGISLFMVPKFLPDAEGRLGPRNSLRVVSLEHKLGIHGSPTCVMEYDGAKGWLVGEENKGMAAMFTMMNNARLAVGAQGVGIAEAALQQALAYAADRHQGATPLSAEGPILDHADVRRMLAVMRAEVFAARSIALACAVAIDMASATGSADWQARAAFLTPIAKAHGTDIGCEVAQLGLQVHGGMGYVEETGAAQFARDVRITAIYEGTNGIQAMDLVGRKMADGGEAAFRLIDEVQRGAEAARVTLPDLAGEVWQAAEALREATEAMVAQELNDRFAGAVPYLRAFARVLGAEAHLKAALADPDRLALARVMIRRILPEHGALLAQVREGAAGLYALRPEDLAA